MIKKTALYSSLAALFLSLSGCCSDCAPSQEKHLESYKAAAMNDLLEATQGPHVPKRSDYDPNSHHEQQRYRPING